MSFETLPPEILICILEAAPSPNDLYHIVSASPTCYRIYALKPDAYVQLALQNLPDETSRLLVTILSVPRYPGWSQHQAHSNEIGHLLDQCFSPGILPFSYTASGFESMRRLYWLLNKHIENYVYKARNYFETFDQRVLRRPINRTWLGEGDTQAGDPFWLLRPRLTENERIRLQRAFLRFELYCRAFAGNRGSRNPYSATNQFNIFLSRLTLWEMEELCCVYNYFSSATESIMNKVEKEVIETVVSTPGVRLTTPTVRAATEESPVDTPLGDLDLVTLKLFENIRMDRGSDYVISMTSMGFEFIFDLLHSDMEDQKRLIHTAYPNRSDSLPEAIRCTPGITVAEPWQSDVPSFCNLGYHMLGPLTGRGLRALFDNDVVNNLPRELGWVFWDSWRIISPKIYYTLYNARYVEFGALSLLFYRQRKKRYEMREKGSQVSLNEVRRIEGIIRDNISDDET